MTLELPDVTVTGSALPMPFVEQRLEALLRARKLLGTQDAAEKGVQAEQYRQYQQGIAKMSVASDGHAVFSSLLAPLAELLGYATVEVAEPVATAEGSESGGFLFKTADSELKLRAWAMAFGTELDAPVERGRAYRFRPAAVVRRVLLAKAERVGLLTNGKELRLVLFDPSGGDNHVAIALDCAEGWRSAVAPPDSFRLVRALCCSAGVAAIAELVEQARLAQTGAKKSLRDQARRAVELFIQGWLDAPENREQRDHWPDLDEVARRLWHEGLILVYRILFILKLESVTDPGCRIGFTDTDAWRRSLSPSTALAPLVEAVQARVPASGTSLASSLRELFRLFSRGACSTGLSTAPLGGALFGDDATPLLDSLSWSDGAVATLLDALLWISSERKTEGKARTGQRRERVDYASLDVEDLGSIYEALLELEPGISNQPMCRLRRSKLEVVVPLAQGDRCRKQPARAADTGDDDDDVQGGNSSKKSKVSFVEEIPAHRFYLRVGLGRKASGSYYTPQVFVRFLVHETLGPQLAERSPIDNPDPLGILRLKVLDPTMGSGHFLVEACRYLGEALYEACCLWVEQARVGGLDLELARGIPSLVAASAESALGQRQALSLCRRLVAANCLYGIDKNPLAAELARVALWLESHAEGLPLTFAQHHLAQGDSVVGPQLEHLLTLPVGAGPIGETQPQSVVEQLRSRLAEAISQVTGSACASDYALDDLERKRSIRRTYEGAIQPFRLLAAAWSGGAMLDNPQCDAAYLGLFLAVARGDAGVSVVEARPLLRRMIELGHAGIPFELQFPEVFYPGGTLECRSGFDAVLGNPPWDAIKFNTKEFLAAFDLRVLEAPTKTERDAVELALTKTPTIGGLFRAYREEYECLKRSNDRLYLHQKVMIDGDLAGRQLDLFRVLVERGCQLMRVTGYLGFVVPSAFHTAAGAAGVRKLVSREHRLVKYVSFLNTRRLFDITPGFEFGLLVAGGKQILGVETLARFGLTDPELLASPAALGLLRYPTETLCDGNPYFAFPTLRSDDALRALVACRETQRIFLDLQATLGIDMRSTPTSVHMTHEAKHFVRTSRRAEPGGETLADRYVSALASGCAILHEGATFNRYTDGWAEVPRFALQAARVSCSERWKTLSSHYKLAVRAIVGSSPEKCIAAILPPGCLVSNSALVEGTPECRSTGNALKLLALLNAATVSWLLSFHADLNVNLFALKYLPAPKLELPDILAHGALRLSCNHAGYRELWREQLGPVWREASQAESWPVLQGDARRWAVRAQLDAVVARIYGLNRAQYEHVLSSFNQSTFRGPSRQCLVAFDELETRGLDGFSRMHDPYWDIPLATTLPVPAANEALSSMTRTQSGGAGSPKPAPVERPRKLRPRQ